MFAATHTLLCVLAVNLMAFSAHAATETPSKKDLRSDIADLTFAKETEEIEVMDQKLLEDEARREARRLEREARNLENQIARMKSQSQRLDKKIDRQSERYRNSIEVLRRVEAKARVIEKAKNSLQARVDKIKGRTDKVEQRAIAKQQWIKQVQGNITDLNREKAQLISRQREAEISIERSKRRIKQLQYEGRRMSQDVRRLRKAVAKREAEAEALESKANY